MSDELRAKLSRLLKRPEAPAAPPEVADELAGDAERFDDDIELDDDAADELELPAWFRARAATPSDGPLSPRAFTLGPPADLAESSGPRGPFAARTREYAATHAHGDVALAECLAAPPAELAWLCRDPALEALDLERCVYLDIETTGLSGGAGTIPFLVALGRFERDGEPDGERDGVPDGQRDAACAPTFRLWQAFLRDPGEEAAALAEVAERVRAASGVVSFFGKSFDRHRLEDKMRLHRIAPPFDGKPHLDLYHPLARLYRGAYRDGRLATFEDALCGVAREDDLPGSLAPIAWLDFLRGRPHRLEGVFRHNELDVLSLVTLAAHLGRARAETRPDGGVLPGAARARARGIAELHAARREHALALEWLERAVTRAGNDEGELWFRHADCLRRMREHERALDGFLRLARERKDALAARAWAEVARLARRLKRAELEAEARELGTATAERTLFGRARARVLERCAGARRRSGAARESSAAYGRAKSSPPAP